MCVELGTIVGGNIKFCNTIVRHSHDSSASAEILSVGPMVISMNTHDFPT